MLGSRVCVVDNDGASYYGMVEDALVVVETGELFMRCKYDTIMEETQVDNAVGFQCLGIVS